MTCVDEPSGEAAETPAAPVDGDSTPSSDVTPFREGFIRKAVRRLWRPFRPAVLYPRVTIELALTVAATVVALSLLPPFSIATAGLAPIAAIRIVKPSNVPTYLLFDAYQGGQTVVVGMDTNVAVTWELEVVYSVKDKLADRSTSSNASFVGRVSSKNTGWGPNYVAAWYRGTLSPGSRSFTEFKDGYFATYRQSLNQSLPKDDGVIDFNITGPAPLTIVSGATDAVSLPELLQENSRTYPGPAAALNSEVFYQAGTYQPVTGAPTVQGGIYWDWLNQGVFLGTTATGLDNAQQQNGQNHLFIAASLFGLAAAGFAGAALEVAELVEKRRRRHSDPL